MVQMNGHGFFQRAFWFPHWTETFIMNIWTSLSSVRPCLSFGNSLKERGQEHWKLFRTLFVLCIGLWKLNLFVVWILVLQHKDPHSSIFIWASVLKHTHTCYHNASQKCNQKSPYLSYISEVFIFVIYCRQHERHIPVLHTNMHTHIVYGYLYVLTVCLNSAHNLKSMNMNIFKKYQKL